MTIATIQPSWKQGFAGPDRLPPAYPGLWTRLVGAWHPTLGVTGAKLFDISRRGNNGVLEGDVTWDTSRFGPVLAVGGVTEVDMIDCGNPAALNDVRPLTIAAWVRFTDIEDTAVIAEKRADFTDDGWVFRLEGTFANSGRLHFEIDDGTTSSFGVTANGTFTANQWYHVAVCWDGGLVPTTNFWVYVDGVVAPFITTTNNATLTISDAASPLTWGGSNKGNRSALNGDFASGDVWNRILAPSEIKLLHKDPHAVPRSMQQIPVGPAVVGVTGTANPFSMSAVNLFQGKLGA